MKCKISMFQLLIILFTVFSIVKLHKDNNVDVIKIQCDCNEEYLKDCGCYLKSYNRTYRTINVRAVMRKQVNDALVSVQVFRKPLLSPGQYLKLLDETTDYCRFTKGETVNLNVFWKFIRALIRNSAEFPHGCPFKVNATHYVYLDYDAAVKRAVPSILHTGRYMFKFRIYSANVSFYDTQFEFLTHTEGISNSN